jgi:hypothetical protein
VAIVNQVFAHRYIKGSNPVGPRYSFGDGP